LKGPEKNGGHDVTAVFVGAGKTRGYWSDLLFSDQPAIETLGRFSYRQVLSLLDGTDPLVDMVFLESDPLVCPSFRRKGCLIIPEWVGMNIETDPQCTAVLAASGLDSQRSDLRKIRKHGYRYRISRLPEEFDFYYHRMYLPYVSRRFDNLARLSRYEAMKRQWKRGFLILIFKEETKEADSGGLCFIGKDTLYLRNAGIRDGLQELVLQGAFSAVIYFAMQEARKRGLPNLDIGLSRPFLRNGVLAYKKKWGGRILIDPRSQGNWAFKILRFHEGTLSFLENNPLIFRDGKALSGLAFFRGPPASEESLVLIKSHFFHRGMKDLWVVSPSGSKAGSVPEGMRLAIETASCLFKKNALRDDTPGRRDR